MRPPLKAALLSGLVFPGLGQIFLKKYRRGTLLIILVFAGLALMTAAIGIRSAALLENMPKEISTNPARWFSIYDPAGVSSSKFTAACYRGGLAVVVGSWLWGIIDAYCPRCRKQMKS